MNPLTIGFWQTGNLIESWLPVGAVGGLIVAVIGATWTVGSFMRSQEKKLQDLDTSIRSLRTEIDHKFERLEDRHRSVVSHTEFYRWIDRLRRSNPSLQIPAPYDED